MTLIRNYRSKDGVHFKMVGCDISHLTQAQVLKERFYDIAQIHLMFHNFNEDIGLYDHLMKFRVNRECTNPEYFIIDVIVIAWYSEKMSDYSWMRIPRLMPLAIDRMINYVPANNVTLDGLCSLEEAGERILLSGSILQKFTGISFLTIFSSVDFLSGPGILLEMKGLKSHSLAYNTKINEITETNIFLQESNKRIFVKKGVIYCSPLTLRSSTM